MKVSKSLAARTPRSGGSGLAALLGFGVLAALALGWWYAHRAAGGEEIDPDRVVAVQRRDLVDAVNANGSVEPLARVAVMSRASGIIKELFVDEGDVVRRGQVLAELDREQLEAQIVQDQAELLSAEARLAEARARVDEARVRLEDPEVEFLRREAERLEQLFESGDASYKERDDAQRVLAVADFRITQVRASLPVLASAVSEAEANLASAQAALERSQTTLREATIRCPMDGIVLVRDREVGDGVSSILTAGGNATQIMTLGDLSEMYVEARVDEVDLGKISVGMPALISVDAHRGRSLDGVVARIAPAGSVDDNGIVTFEVRVTVEDPDKLLRPDMTADARLVMGRRDGALTLPQRALRRGARGEWTVSRVVGEGESASLETRVVEIGLSDGLQTEIQAGLDEGDRVLLPDDGPPGGRRF